MRDVVVPWVLWWVCVGCAVSFFVVVVVTLPVTGFLECLVVVVVEWLVRPRRRDMRDGCIVVVAVRAIFGVY